MRIDQLRKDFEVQIRWIAFPLHPETPEEGLALEELYAGRLTDMDQRMKHLKQVAEEVGLPLGERKKTFNSRLAQELAKWAESKGKEDEFNAAVFRAYYVDGKNIGKVDELVLLTNSVGLPDQEAKRVLESRAFKEAVDSDWFRSHSLGITGVPTFVMGHQSVVGFQPYEVLEQFLRTNGVKKRS